MPWTKDRLPRDCLSLQVFGTRVDILRYWNMFESSFYHGTEKCSDWSTKLEENPTFNTEQLIELYVFTVYLSLTY